MFPLTSLPNTNFRCSRRSIRSASDHLPSKLTKGAIESPSTTKQEPRPPASALPTPPDTEDAKGHHGQQRYSSKDDKWQNPHQHSFPLEPVTFPLATEDILPQTPNRRSFSANAHKKPFSTSYDRYISTRSRPSTPQSSTETFHIGKNLAELSPTEKFLRHKSATLDPFRPIKAPKRADQLQSSTTREFQHVRRSHYRTIGFSAASEIAPNVPNLQNRQASAGNVWAISGSGRIGSAEGARAVSNGTGGFITSGTNAPMYESRFLDDLSTDQDVDQMEQRLADALDIDRVCRIFENTRPHEGQRSVSTGSVGMKRKRLYLNQRTRWEDGIWTSSDSIKRESEGGRKAGGKSQKSPFQQRHSDKYISSSDQPPPHRDDTVLDAPELRDDYYCTVLAYCPVTTILAVGLGNKVYLWSEDAGVHYPHVYTRDDRSTHVTSLSFSSKNGGHSILAVGRNNGQISLWSVYDSDNIRFTSQQPSPVACLSFKPVTTLRPSEKFGSLTPVEEMLVGDEIGHIYYYSIEWLTQQQIDIHGWNGHMKLLARIEVHTQQICGLAWSPDGALFATGANDNNCFLFDTQKILRECAEDKDTGVTCKTSTYTFWDKFPVANILSRNSIAMHADLSQHSFAPATARHTVSAQSENSRALQGSLPQRSTVITPGRGGSVLITSGQEKHRWVHSAAVKAIAFCPWQRGLIATGGGSNDRAIHFFHVYSGACLAVINVHAQVTSLIWSNTRREIAATFGYPQPEHPIRIAVFSWPDCRQVVAVAWPSELRALYAIAYPGSSFSARTRARLAAGRRENGFDDSERVQGGWYDRTIEEGCIIVAGSDECVRFHEVWAGRNKCLAGGRGTLGGSEILEGLDGTDSTGRQTIR